MKQAFLILFLVAGAFAMTFSVAHEGDLFVGEDNDYLVTVSGQGGSPVENARIRLYRDSDLLVTGQTDSSGTIRFVLHPLNDTLLAFSITHPDYNEYVLFRQTERRIPVQNETSPIPEGNKTAAPITGLITLNPGEQGIFFAMMLVVFISLFAGSFLYYKSFAGDQPEEELAEGTGWEMTRVFDPYDGMNDKLNSL